jgi:hypothetical protein
VALTIIEKQLNRRKTLRGSLLALPTVIVIGALFYYVYIPNSAGFDAARVAVTDHAGVQSQIGHVQQVTVLPFRPFRVRFVGSEQIVLLSLGVRGDRGEMKVRIRMVRSNDRWRVDYWKRLD